VTPLYVASVIGALVAAFVVYLLAVALMPGFSVPAQRLERGRQPISARASPRSGPREDVTFEVKGTLLSAWLYRPADVQTPVPCIVMAHGLGGTKDAGLDSYAARFQEAGFAVLAFDYRYLGESGGEPRQLVRIPSQLEDTAAAIDFARGLGEVDPLRIALWGTSLSAGHAVVTVARERSIACVVAQCPLLHGSEPGLEYLKRRDFRSIFRLIPHGQRDLVRSFLGLSPHRIPLFGKSGSIAVLADDGAWSAFEQLTTPGFSNQVCARIVDWINTGLSSTPRRCAVPFCFSYPMMK
jgi:pimeloyl-ACP methyl ester carboxylesterase